MHARIGFYPFCGNDIKEPLEILNGRVDVVVFCDEDLQYKDYWHREKSLKRLKPTPVSGFVCREPSAVVLDIRRIDVLFYRRRDGRGAGENFFDAQPYLLPLVLSRMPESGGLLITDGSICPPDMWERIVMDVKVIKYGCHFELRHPQPFQDKQPRLLQIQVRPYVNW